MTNGTFILKGTVHGRTIELDREPGLPDGQQVSVTLQAKPTGEGIARAFGSWAQDADDLDEFLARVRQDRQSQRQEPML